MINLGIDVGSLFTKVVVLKDDAIVAHEIVPTTGNIGGEIDYLIKKALDSLNVGMAEINAVCATGSGADLIRFADFTEDEVSSFTAAVSYYMPGVEMALDIGGQSITTALLDPDGSVRNFLRNDKCASGSGRFLEVIGRAIGVRITDLDSFVLKAERAVSVSNQCGVFAESEVISHMNAGEKPENIAAGICEAVANIVVSQARKLGDGRKYTLTGGVAKVRSVVERLNAKLSGEYIAFPHNPALASAVGAALFAWDS